ncbi:MAG: polysaccharide pyruvyl transferase family protein [Marinilabiliaceae bacterium]|nr:polysaccharide pyruvyl transferase family protein [Marinilabiliaceae bacterium]
MKKNILFVGDLRAANNYGAIATTETLINMLTDEYQEATFKFIDYRSLYGPTPINGFPKSTKSIVASTKEKIISLLPKPLIKTYIKLFKKAKPSVDFVPYKLSQFESYYQNMKNGTCLQYEKRLLEWADIVYINGEGNIVNGTDKYGKYRIGARYILFMAWLGRVKFNLPTLIVNHTVDPNNYNAFEIIEAVYPKLDKVFVRETLSIPLLEKHNVKNAEFVADALFSFKSDENWEPSNTLRNQIDFSKPFICLGDSSGIKNAYSQVKWDVCAVYSDIIAGLRTIVDQIVFIDGYNGCNENINRVIKQNKIGHIYLNNCSYKELYQVLKRAKLFVSGRWHASILSILANTPILCWGADSHKTRSLYTLLDYKYRFFEVASLPANIPELIDEAKRITNDAQQIKEIMTVKVNEYSTLTRKNITVLKDF